MLQDYVITDSACYDFHRVIAINMTNPPVMVKNKDQENYHEFINAFNNFLFLCRATPNRLDGKGQGGSKGNQRIGARSARSNKVEKETTVTLQRVKCETNRRFNHVFSTK